MENNTAVYISAASAAISAATALISVIFSLKRSRRQMLDLLKIEILEFTSTAQGNEAWVETMNLYDGRTPVNDLLNLLNRKFKRKKWYRLLPAALAELRNEGYHQLLGMSPSTKTLTQPLEIIV